MVCFNPIDERIREPSRVPSCEVEEHTGYCWVHHRPVAVIDIDLDRDHFSDIVRQLDRWERMERREGLTLEAV